MNTFIRNIDEKIHRVARAAAALRDETLNDFIVRAIETAVADDPVAKKIIAANRGRRREVRPSPR